MVSVHLMKAFSIWNWQQNPIIITCKLNFVSIFPSHTLQSLIVLGFVKGVANEGNRIDAEFLAKKNEPDIWFGFVCVCEVCQNISINLNLLRFVYYQNSLPSRQYSKKYLGKIPSWITWELWIQSTRHKSSKVYYGLLIVCFGGDKVGRKNLYWPLISSDFLPKPNKQCEVNILLEQQSC